MIIHKFQIFEDVSLSDARDYLQINLAKYKAAEGLYLWKYYDDISTYLLIKNDMNYNKAFISLKAAWEHFGHRLYSGEEAKKRYTHIPEDHHDFPDEAGVFNREQDIFDAYNLLDGEVYQEYFYDERIAALWALGLIDKFDVRKLGGEKQFVEHYFTENN